MHMDVPFPKRIIMKTLSQIFGGVVFETNANKQFQELLAFAEKFPDETTFNTEEKEVVFSTECETFTIRADINANLEPVYQLLVVGYTPRRVLFESQYCASIDEVIAVSTAAVANLFKPKSKSKSKPKKCKSK